MQYKMRQRRLNKKMQTEKYNPTYKKLSLTMEYQGGKCTQINEDKTGQVIQKVKKTNNASHNEIKQKETSLETMKI